MSCLNELRYAIFNTYSGSIQSKMTDKLSYRWLLSFSVILNDLWIIIATTMFRFVVNHVYFAVALLLLQFKSALFIYFRFTLSPSFFFFFFSFSLLEQITWRFCCCCWYCWLKHFRPAWINRWDGRRRNKKWSSFSNDNLNARLLAIWIVCCSIDRWCAWYWKLPVISSR